MDAIFSGVDTAVTETYLRFCNIFILLSFVSIVLIAVSRRHIFKKLGMPGWQGIIPIYSDYKLFKSRWRVKPFWVLAISTIVYYAGSILTGIVMSNSLSAVTGFNTTEEIKAFFVPYLAIYGILAAAYAIISLAITLNLNYRLAQSYEEGFGYALGLTILPFVFYPLIAFAKKQETRRKRPLQFVSAALAIAMVFRRERQPPVILGAIKKLCKNVYRR